MNMEQGAMNLQRLINTGKHAEVRALLEVDDWTSMMLIISGDQNETHSE